MLSLAYTDLTDSVFLSQAQFLRGRVSTIVPRGLPLQPQHGTEEEAGDFAPLAGARPPAAAAAERKGQVGSTTEIQQRLSRSGLSASGRNWYCSHIQLCVERADPQDEPSDPGVFKKESLRSNYENFLQLKAPKQSRFVSSSLPPCPHVSPCRMRSISSFTTSNLI